MGKFVTIEHDKLNDNIIIHVHTKKQFRMDTKAVERGEKAYAVYNKAGVTFKFRNIFGFISKYFIS